MKKMISVLVLAVLVLTMVASVASAASNAFGSKMITCAANAEVGLNNNNETKNKAANTGRLYVRHYLYGDWGGSHTNYFRAAKTKTGASTSAMFGGNWMAPDTANFVSSASINYTSAWYAYGRGNTNYGLSRIEITGYSDQDA